MCHFFCKFNNWSSLPVSDQDHTCVAGNARTEILQGNQLRKQYDHLWSHCAEGNLAIIATGSECEKAAREMGYDYGGEENPIYNHNTIGGCSYTPYFHSFKKVAYFSKNLKAHGCHFTQADCLCKRGLYTICAPYGRLVKLAIRGYSGSHSQPVCPRHHLLSLRLVIFTTRSNSCCSSEGSPVHPRQWQGYLETRNRKVQLSRKQRMRPSRCGSARVERQQRRGSDYVQ